MKRYKHIFFDLDLTLWDFESNSSATLLEILDKFGLKPAISNEQKFIDLYKIYNEQVWNLYKLKKINKEKLRFERFRLLFNDFGITDEKLIDDIQNYYITTSPRKQVLIEGANEVLEYLYPNYSLYIVSNGFIETQRTKLECSGIIKYFKYIFTSDQAGFAKPDKHIFQHCLKTVNASKSNSLFIGDDLENDIKGPKKMGIDQVFFNPNKKIADVVPTYEITALKELKSFL